jgi:hypothetical protein
MLSKVINTIELFEDEVIKFHGLSSIPAVFFPQDCRLSNPRLPVLASLALSSSVLNLLKPSATTFGRCWFYFCLSAQSSKLVSRLHKNKTPNTVC